ncbi:MAG: hypothetical protein AAF346_18615 [Pseudomonadota bacterium]
MVSTRNTDEDKGWRQLLQSLTDAELDRYGSIAEDQRNLEYDHWWAQILSAIGAMLALVSAIWSIHGGGSVWTALLLVLVATVLGIWPYQKVKMRGLWDKHCKAVAEEKARRSQGGV